ncbi:MAG: hypothetical protein KTR26_01910 [Flammeovirgaceae bacterium]|nr:hypothetical protein [Flammeovirgaceae bacterium]
MEKLFSDINFYEYGDEDCNNSKNGSICLYFNNEHLHFKSILDINFPVGTQLRNDIELFIGNILSKTFRCQALVAGDFYDNKRFPYSWLIIDDDKFYEAWENESEDGSIKFEVIKKVEIRLPSCLESNFKNGYGNKFILTQNRYCSPTNLKLSLTRG